MVTRPPTRGREIKKPRPCVVVSPDELNEHLATIIVAPLTTGGHTYPVRVPCRFLVRPHVVEWWGPPPSRAEVEQEFGALTSDQSTTRAYLVFDDGAPIGYIQSYVAMGSGDGRRPEQDPGVRGIDQFLAHREQLGRGLGTTMVRAFVQRLFADRTVTRIQTDPSPLGGAIARDRLQSYTIVPGRPTDTDSREWHLRRSRPVYVLGHSPGELARLSAQARLFDEQTGRLLLPWASAAACASSTSVAAEGSRLP